MNKCSHEPACQELAKGVVCYEKWIPYHQIKSVYAPAYIGVHIHAYLMTAVYVANVMYVHNR